MKKKVIEKNTERQLLDPDQKSIAGLFSKDFLSEEAVYELSKNKELEQKSSRDYLIYKPGNKKKDKTYDFQRFKTITSFEREIYSHNISLDNAL